jgi:hypothetical protein
LLPINLSQTVFAPGTEEVGTVTVPVRRLDAALAAPALPRPILLKIDTQGSELALLKGAEGLFPVIDYVYVEVSFVEFYTGQPLADQILDYMHSHGYRMTGIGGTARNSRDKILQADLLFERVAR